MCSSPVSVSFRDLEAVSVHYFGPPRLSPGSHRISATPWPGEQRCMTTTPHTASRDRPRMANSSPRSSNLEHSRGSHLIQLPHCSGHAPSSAPKSTAETPPTREQISTVLLQQVNVFRMRSTWSATRRPVRHNPYNPSTCPGSWPQRVRALREDEAFGNPVHIYVHNFRRSRILTS